MTATSHSVKRTPLSPDSHRSCDGQWTLLPLATRPNSFDTSPMPASSDKWKYRAIYSNDAHRIGQWSNIAEIVVGG